SFFFFSSRRRHTRFSRDWSSDVCSSDLGPHFLSAGWRFPVPGDEAGPTGLRTRRHLPSFLFKIYGRFLAEAPKGGWRNGTRLNTIRMGRCPAGFAAEGRIKDGIRLPLEEMGSIGRPVFGGRLLVRS